MLGVCCNSDFASPPAAQELLHVPEYYHKDTRENRAHTTYSHIISNVCILEFTDKSSEKLFIAF